MFGKLVLLTNLNKHLRLWIDIVDITDDKIDTVVTNDIKIYTNTNDKVNRTLLVGPSFCGKT